MININELLRTYKNKSIEELKKEGFDINEKNENGDTYLHILCSCCYSNKRLLEEIDSYNKNAYRLLERIGLSIDINNTYDDSMNEYENSRDRLLSWQKMLSAVINIINYTNNLNSNELLKSQYDSSDINRYSNGLIDFAKNLIDNNIIVSTEHLAILRDFQQHGLILIDNFNVSNAEVRHDLLLELARWLIANKIDINATNRDSITPLHVACNYSIEEIVRLLLKNNVKTNVFDNFGISPLYVAYFRQNKKIIELLLMSINKDDINNDIEVPYMYFNGSCLIDSLTPLALACKIDSKEVVEKLIESGADVNRLNSFGSHFPLIIAYKNGNKEIAELLLNNGANPKLANIKNGRSLKCIGISKIFSTESEEVEFMNFLASINIKRITIDDCCSNTKNYELDEMMLNDSNTSERSFPKMEIPCENTQSENLIEYSKESSNNTKDTDTKMMSIDDCCSNTKKRTIDDCCFDEESTNTRFSNTPLYDTSCGDELVDSLKASTCCSASYDILNDEERWVLEGSDTENYWFSEEEIIYKDNVTENNNHNKRRKLNDFDASERSFPKVEIPRENTQSENLTSISKNSPTFL